MRLQALPYRFAVCKLNNMTGLNLNAPFFALAKTDDEVSLICPSEHTPQGCIAIEDGFCGFRVCGSLDFSLVGVLAKLTVPLAEQGIRIVSFSTYDTDYLLVKEADYPRAVRVLTAAGYEWANTLCSDTTADT